VAGLVKLVASFCGAPILPDDCIANGITGLAIPDDSGFMLVGDAQASHVAGSDAGATQCLHSDGDLRKPNFLGVLLHPAWFWINLTDFLLSHGPDLAFLIKNDGAHARGPGIQGEYVLHESCGS
jgi:hypothetical protein